jgi:hypothetical protein
MEPDQSPRRAIELIALIFLGFLAVGRVLSLPPRGARSSSVIGDEGCSSDCECNPWFSQWGAQDRLRRTTCSPRRRKCAVGIVSRRRATSTQPANDCRTG